MLPGLGLRPALRGMRSTERLAATSQFGGLPRYAINHYRTTLVGASSRSSDTREPLVPESLQDYALSVTVGVRPFAPQVERSAITRADQRIPPTDRCAVRRGLVRRASVTHAHDPWNARPATPTR